MGGGWMDDGERECAAPVQPQQPPVDDSDVGPGRAAGGGVEGGRDREDDRRAAEGDVLRAAHARRSNG